MRLGEVIPDVRGYLKRANWLYDPRVFKVLSFALVPIAVSFILLSGQPEYCRAEGVRCSVFVFNASFSAVMSSFVLLGLAVVSFIRSRELRKEAAQQAAWDNLTRS